MNSKNFKRYARAMQRLTGRKYQDCLRHLKEHGISEEVRAEVAQWKAMTPEERAAEKESQP